MGRRTISNGASHAINLHINDIVQKKPEVEFPRSYRDYTANVEASRVPAGVRLGFLSDPYGEVCWGELPDGEDWFRLG